MDVREEKIVKRLQENYDLLVDMGYEVVGVFNYGSDNYSLSYEGSDIDCKAVVVPKFNDFVMGKKEVSTTHVWENDEHLEIKSLKTMLDTIKKQNINFVEILFTKYRIMNPKYEAMFQPMFDNNEAIAHYNNYASINCMVGMVMEKYKALEHPYPATIKEIEERGFSSKQLHHIVRIAEFMERYIGGVSYAECLISETPEELIDLKRGIIKGEQIPVEKARSVAKFHVELTKSMKDVYFENNPVEINIDVETLMNDVLLNIIRHSFVSELKEMN